jgi:maltose-binding protein MalE
MRKSYLVFALLIVATMLLAACGGGAEEPTATPVPPAPAAEPTATPVPEPTAVPEPEPTEAPVEEAAAPEGCPAGTLVVWADNLRAPLMKSLTDQVLAETGICLDVQEVGFGDIRSKISLSGPAGEGPDIFIGAHDWLGELNANGVVAEIDLGAKAGQFFEPAVTAFQYEGKQLGVPYGTENIAMVYNTDLVPTPPTTLEELETIAQQLTDEGTVTQALGVPPDDPYHFEPWLTSNGGYIFGVENGEYQACDVGLDSEGGVAALTWAKDLVDKGLLSPDVNLDTARQLFDQGQMAMIVTGPWDLPRFRDAAVPYAVAAVPEGLAAASPFMGVQGFMINAFSENKLLAQSFLMDYVAADGFMQALFEADPRPSAWMAVREATEDPDLAGFTAAGEAAHPMPAIPAMNAVWDSWKAAIQTVFQGAATPEDAAKNAADQVRSAAGCP